MLRARVSNAVPDSVAREAAATAHNRTLVQRQPGEEEEELLQTKEIPGHSPQVTPGVASEIASMRGGGQPLPAAERAFFEPRFGYDFRNVRIHTGEQAAKAARAVSAKAFTVGRDVVFDNGMYNAGTASGRKLLAHELTHVIQQGDGLSFGLSDHAPRIVFRTIGPPMIARQVDIEKTAAKL